MKFIEAIVLAKEGKKIRNINWEDHIFIYLDPIPQTFYWDNNYINSPYILNYSDSVSSWEMYEEKPKTYTFIEAIKALDEGKSIYRAEIDEAFIFRKKEIFHKHRRLFSYKDITATDWVIIDEED